MKLPSGVFSVGYGRDMAVVRTKTQWGILVAFLGLLAALPFLVTAGWLATINLMVITVIAVTGLHVLTGLAGEFSVGQSALVGIGAFTSGILAGKLGMPFWATLPASLLMSGIVSAMFALPGARIKGFYLALVTIALQYVFVFVVYHLPESVAGGAWGVHVPTPKLGGLALKGDTKIFYIVVSFAIVGIVFAKNLARSKIGRAFVATRDSDLAAKAMGVNVFYYKVLAAFICGLYAGLAGFLWAQYVRFVSVNDFTLWASIWFVGMLIVGGLGSLTGAILGVVLLRSLEYTVMTYGPKVAVHLSLGTDSMYSLVNLLFALVVILFLILQPRGVAYGWERLKEWYRSWPFSQ